MPLPIPIVLGGGALLLLGLFGKKKGPDVAPAAPGEAPAPSQPFEPDAKALLTYVDNGILRWKPEVAAALYDTWVVEEPRFVQNVPPEFAMFPGGVISYKLVYNPGVNPANSMKAVVDATIAGNQAILANLECVTGGSTNRYAVIADPKIENAAIPAGNWAVFADKTHVPVAAVPGIPSIPGQPAPGQPAPGQPAPGQPAPGQPAPGQPAPGQPVPNVPIPGVAPNWGPSGACQSGVIPTDTPPDHLAQGGSPYTVRAGDTGSGLAKLYTGDALRYKEIGTVPGMRVYRDPKTGYDQIAPWRGLVKLPLSWRIWAPRGMATPGAPVTPAVSTTPAPSGATSPASYKSGPVDEKTIDEAIAAAEQASVASRNAGGDQEAQIAAARSAAQAVMVKNGYDPNSPEVQGAEIASGSQSAEAVEEAADKIASTFGDWVVAGEVGVEIPIVARLRRKAIQLRAAQEREDTARGHSLFTIRKGDLPASLAQYYTGDSKKFRELTGINPGLKVHHKAGGTFLEPWRGTIKVPLSWKLWSKPLPLAKA